MHFLSFLAAGEQDLKNFETQIKNLISTVYPYVLSIVGALVVLWAVFIGVKYWQAGNQEKQREAKQYLLNFIIGVVIIFVLAVGVTALIGWLGDWSKTAMG